MCRPRHCRDARWGRVMEAAGEDPYLSSDISKARVRGFQGEDLAADDVVAVETFELVE